MKVICLKRNSMKYTCNAYLILGSWNSLQDTNTLIDVGIDASIINEIEKINTGVGKRPVEQIIITHEHFSRPCRRCQRGEIMVQREDLRLQEIPRCR